MTVVGVVVDVTLSPRVRKYARRAPAVAPARSSAARSGQTAR
jgi:hypothetical protein